MANRRSRPRSGLTREKVLDAAIAFVDEHGPAALSTRKLGTALGVEGMTLYYYVPNKAALLDGMVERILQWAIAEAGPLDSPVPWPETVRNTATALRTVLRRHPGTLAVIATRPAASPAALRILEDGLAALCAQDVPLDLAMDVLNAAVVFTIGHTLAEVGRTPGADADDTAAPDVTAYPHVARAYTTGAGLDSERRYDRTLQMIIDGHAALIG
ncbi:TetR/AcrR family transcriptional regulator C-terminal domain-containing protein [Kitasatospora sp. RB6PN24]|uniref:TetR/AcrR family transcriptional regulator C-terminal domain-containing protein n=1 Tax=Kitasatospora humi TaxID=2893891 RepID=UPI001E46FC9B|nr:TetR/AcrR family transcriptional regulator C-terminal domain-containing protein [Kitasatospora humi]MCC9307983.1 TetR/AcrR family transcriptional regulator C-terminal domain-containing protein [Kitasatospora humi]